MNYHALIGAPTPELETALVARFNELPDWEIVGVRHSHQDLAKAIPLAPELELVLLHENLGPTPILQQIRDISTRNPQIAILLMARQITPELVARATEAGARGVVAEDASLDDLEIRATSAADWSRKLQNLVRSRQLEVPGQNHTAHIVAFTGAKGGVGTTTVATHVALRVARTSHATCLVDLDLTTGDITGLLDLNHRRSIADLVDAGSEISASMLAETLYVHPNGPHVLLSPEHGERGEDVTADAVRNILGALRVRYDIILVDCGSTMNEANAMAVELADTAVLVTAPDLASLRGAQRLLEMWERLVIRRKKDALALVVRHHKKNEIQPEFARKLLDLPFLSATVPANYRALEAASNTGDPDRVTDTDMRKAFSQVAEELGLLAPPPDPTAAASGPQPSQADLAAEAFVSGVGGRAKHGDRGSQMLEFVAVVPLLGLALLLVWQIILFGLTSMYASHAANEAARQAALTPDSMALIQAEATKRIIGPWDDDEVFSLTIHENPTGLDYAEVGIEMPWVLSTGDSMVLTARSPIVPE